MNQKNIFTGIAVVLLLQGIFFYVMGDKVVSDSFPGIDGMGKSSAIILMQVLSVLSILVGLISYANRSTPQILGAYTLGFGLFLLLSLKHLLIDHVNVPIPAILIQAGILLSCGYLLMQNNKVKTS